jgi:hypothetical protein
MPPRAEYPPLQFAACRIALGVYLTVFFGFIAAYARELLSSEGVIPNIRMNLRQATFPNVLLVSDTPRAVLLFALVGVLAGALLTVGVFRRVAAGVLWYALACIGHRNTLIPDPSTPFTGWLLLATILVPTGEPLTVSNRSRTPVQGWRFPPALYTAIWLVLGVSYSVSGLVKLSTPEWVDGRALGLFLANSLHRNSVVWSVLSGLPPTLMKLGTWSGLGTELLAGPLSIWRRSRPIAWVALALLHLVVIATMRTTMLSLGALLPLAFAFDAHWIRPVRPRGQEARQLKNRSERTHGAARQGRSRSRRSSASRSARA